MCVRARVAVALLVVAAAAAAAWTAIALRLLRTLQLAADPKLTVESGAILFSFFFLFRRIASGGVDGEKKGEQKG